MKIRLGKLVTIKNKKPKAFVHENDSYKAVLVKTRTGKVECLMFTDAELEKAKSRGKKNKEDQLTQSWISKLLD